MSLCRNMLLAFVFGAMPALSAQSIAGTQQSQQTEVSGVVLMNAYYNDDLVNDRDVPWLAAPRHPIVGSPMEALGSTVRQTRIVFSGWASDVLGGELEGELDVDFFGSRSEDGRREPLPRLRRAVGAVRWSHAWLIFGQEALPISPYDPSSFSAVGVPGFTGSGNLSRWMPQDTALFLDSSRLSVLPLAGRSFHFKPLAASGDYECGQLIGEYTLEMRNEEAHGCIRGLATS